MPTSTTTSSRWDALISCTVVFVNELEGNTDTLVMALAGDQRAFEQFVDTHSRELLVHCYRILGSFEDAEDVLQETWLRAWRRLDTLEDRASLRAWLYKIATNAALDARLSPRTRTLPTITHPRAEPGAPFAPPAPELAWIEPFPNALLPPVDTLPEATVVGREGIALSFLAVLQLLPARQRAALLLRDGLGWRVGEVAETLQMSVSAVNSALQRARATMKTRSAAQLHDHSAATRDGHNAELLDRYVRAWENADIPALVALLRDDASFAMPPLVEWYLGRRDIATFLANAIFTGDAQDRFRLVATRANDCPALAVYQRDDSGVYRPASLQVLMVAGDKIAAITSFLALGEDLFHRFGLPDAL
jgi:RNA polymerase sigma-70 factor (ECF subfamily)